MLKKGRYIEEIISEEVTEEIKDIVIGCLEDGYILARKRTEELKTPGLCGIGFNDRIADINFPNLRARCVEQAFESYFQNNSIPEEKYGIKIKTIKENGYSYIELYTNNLYFTIHHLPNNQLLPREAKFRKKNAKNNPTVKEYLEYNLFDSNKIAQDTKIYGYITHTGKDSLESLCIKIPNKKNNTTIVELDMNDNTNARRTTHDEPITPVPDKFSEIELDYNINEGKKENINTR